MREESMAGRKFQFFSFFYFIHASSLSSLESCQFLMDRWDGIDTILNTDHTIHFPQHSIMMHGLILRDDE